VARAAILAEALRLPADERAKLASELIANIDGEEVEDPTIVEQAWADELEARIARADASPHEGVDWTELRDELKAK